MTIWQTVAALEQEFKERAARFADAKRAAESSRSTEGSRAEEERSGDDDEAVGLPIDSSSSAKGVPDREGEKGEEGRSALSKASDAKRAGDDSLRAVSTVAEGKSSEDAVAPSKLSVAVTSPSSKTPGDFSAMTDGKDTGSPVSRFSVARPHHIPKIDSLSKRLDQIRAEMGEEVLNHHIVRNLYSGLHALFHCDISNSLC